ncbi:hypothetical protein AB0O28_03340 [Microbispora sp. NPDC088329]|uniref:hypothetical protein n=1 Tax=Microbispora sp. NPDC088329 TaxID=3154869 RepID=UPI0034448B87
MHRPIRLLPLAALTCVGLLTAAPAFADCGCDTPRAATPATLDLDARADVGLGLGLGLAVDLDLDLGLDARAGAETTDCATPPGAAPVPLTGRRDPAGAGSRLRNTSCPIGPSTCG